MVTKIDNAGDPPDNDVETAAPEPGTLSTAATATTREPDLRTLRNRLDQLNQALAGLEQAAGLDSRDGLTDVSITRKLAVFSDGTGNSSAKAEKTNVWRMFQALDQTAPDQLAKYDDGVGTSRNPYLAALGGAFGIGLKDNVLDLYKFICRNYREGDALYAFGFSRGAYTIRCLVELIDTQGVLTNFGSEAELDKLARMAYRDFRYKRMKVRLSSPVRIYRGIRKLFDGVMSLVTGQSAKAPVGAKVPIEFLGLWDTVSAYGMPVKELRPSVAWLLWPMEFKDSVLPRVVHHCSHALSLDDERATFHPILFDESKLKPHQTVSQVWFAGVHSNVGGGYPEDQLSLVTLNWMMDQLRSQRIPPDRMLRIRPEAIEEVKKEQSPFAKLYNSRSGISFLYRYSPRVFAPISHQANPVLPVIHHSVVTRMARGSDNYIPSVLPHQFMVLAPDGNLQTMPQAIDELTQGAGAPEPLLRFPPDGSLDLVLDTVWWRRAGYLATYGFALMVLLFPWYAAQLHSWVTAGDSTHTGMTPADAIRTICFLVVQVDRALGDFLLPLAAAGSKLAPDFLNGVFNQIASYPVEFATASLLLWASYSETNRLHAELRDLSRLAWDSRREHAFRNACREKVKANRTFSLLLLGLLDLTFLYFAVSFLPAASAREFGVIVFVINLAAALQFRQRQQLIGRLNNSDIPVFQALGRRQLATTLRTNRQLRKFGLWLKRIALPCAFTLTLLYALAIPANKVAYEVGNIVGAYCRPASQPAAGQPFSFDTKSFCGASGVQLEKGLRYEVVLQAKDEWKDQDVKASPAGVESGSPLYFLATPFKRNWSAGWFQPIARVGSWGTEEYAFKPCAPAGGATKCAVAQFTAQRTAGLYVYVNDAVVMLPFLRTYFYGNNSGSATITVQRIQQ